MSRIVGPVGYYPFTQTLRKGWELMEALYTLKQTLLPCL